MAQVGGLRQAAEKRKDDDRNGLAADADHTLFVAM